MACLPIIVVVMTNSPSPVLTDPRSRFGRTAAVGRQLVAAVRPDQLGLPTPCPDFDVQQLLGHLVVVLERVACLGRGENSLALPPVITGVADDGWVDRWTQAGHAVQAAWTDDAVLEREMVLPWAQLAGRDMLDLYLSELVVHLWDLARSTGQNPVFADDVIAAARAAIERQLPGGNRLARFEQIVAAMPADNRPAAPPYGDPVTVPSDTSDLDHLIAWNGRNPGWQPA
jgi:uncharacterized protein (TIGR03086 family)